MAHFTGSLIGEHACWGEERPFGKRVELEEWRCGAGGEELLGEVGSRSRGRLRSTAYAPPVLARLALAV